jgi:3-methylfumaryl-CoA hydratase
MTEPDLQHLRTWIGRTQSTTDTISASTAERMAATLDSPHRVAEGDELPPGWHWLYFLPTTPQHAIDTDGHAARGEFLPPVKLPRRMWAGGRLNFARPLRIGQTAQRESRIMDVAQKDGRTGTLVFVTVRHEVRDDQGLLLAEDQDLVYREAPAPSNAAPTPRPASAEPAREAAWSRTYTPDPVWLFRYSALTFNGHRIHYDRGYCAEEGYPGLVVHGPLIATLLLELLRERLAERRLESFHFRARQPLFDTEPFTVNGRLEVSSDGKSQNAALWAARRGEVENTEVVAMQAEATFTA